MTDKEMFGEARWVSPREIKEQTIELIRRDLGTVDMVVYSLAAPRRTVMSREGDPITYSSVLKTVGQPYTSKSIDLRTNQVTQVTVEPATEEEIDNTVKVMGGEDWQDWIAALDEAGVLADGAVTVAYSYIGPGQHQVFPLKVEVAVHQKILLLRADGGGHTLHIRVAKESQNSQCLTV